MSAVQLSGIGITAIRNKLGNQVFTRNRAGEVARNYVIPFNTITTARTNARNNFATACSLWSLLTDEQVARWQVFAQRFTRRNSIGQSYKLGARSAFIECNNNLLCALQMPIDSPVFNSYVFPLQRASFVTCSVTSIFLSVLVSGGTSLVPADTVCVVSASPSVSAGINFPRNNFQVIDVLTSSSDMNGPDFYTPYAAIFGAPVAGAKVFFRLSLVNSLSGKKCVPITFAAIVTP